MNDDLREILRRQKRRANIVRQLERIQAYRRAGVSSCGDRVQEHLLRRQLVDLDLEALTPSNPSSKC